MTELGVVTKGGEIATVSVDKKDECSKCGMCLFPKNASKIEFSANNAVGASEGDKVIIERVAETKLIGALLVFVVPLILIGLSALITYLAIGDGIWLPLTAVGLITAWYFILSLIDKKLKALKKYSAVITEIIKENEDE